MDSVIVLISTFCFVVGCTVVALAIDFYNKRKAA